MVTIVLRPALRLPHASGLLPRVRFRMPNGHLRAWEVIGRLTVIGTAVLPVPSFQAVPQSVGRKSMIAPLRYCIIQLPSLQGATTSAYAVSSTGRVVFVSMSPGIGDRIPMSYHFQQGAARLCADRTVRGLPMAINGSNLVVGMVHTGSAGTRAAVFASDHAILLDDSDSDSSGALGISDSGVIVGYRFRNGARRPTIFSVNAAPKEVPWLQNRSGMAKAVNGHGAITGYVTRVGRPDSECAFIALPSSMTLLGASEPGSCGNAINDNGTVVGHFVRRGARYACSWTTKPKVVAKQLAGAGSAAHGINKAGDVVGSFAVRGTVLPHAFISRSGRLMDLNALIDRRSGWLLVNALSINDSGQICGWGMLRGKERGFLLDPVVRTPLGRARSGNVR